MKRAHPDLSPKRDGYVPPIQGYDILPRPRNERLFINVTLDELHEQKKREGPRWQFEKARI